MVLNKKFEESSSTSTSSGEEPRKQTPSQERIDITKSVADEHKRLVQPAGVGGAVLGFLFGGPILSALLGFSSAYAVRKKNGPGDIARSMGELAISVQEKTAEFEEKTRIKEKTVNGINNFCDDEGKKSIAFKARAFLVSTWLAASNYTKENQLLERGVEETGKGLEFLGKKIQKKQKKTKYDPVKEDIVFISTDEAEFKDQYTEMTQVATH